jgi:predicted Zn-dependent peptidase
MKKWILKNGMTLIYDPKSSDSVAMQVLVNVGSNWEPAHLRGISHFLEHMVFEGTTKRKDAKTIANEIERLGGDTNAYTTNDRTCYHAKVLKKHAVVVLDVLSDILQNPLLRESDTERQKHILFKEIDLVLDEPRFYQWVLFQKTLFKNHPTRFPTYGTKATVQSTTRQQLVEFFNQYYRPKNMTMAVVGKVPNIKYKVEKAFSKDSRLVKTPVFKRERPPKNAKIRKEKRNVESTYIILGHLTVPRLHKDSYIIDLIDAVLGRGQSGWMFDEIRNKHGLAYEVSTQHVAERDYGYFATYVSISKKNKNKVIQLIKDQLARIQNLTSEELNEAKTYIEGSFYLDQEDTQKHADELCFWEQIGGAKHIKSYMRKIKSITLSEVKKAAKNYFGKNYCLTRLEGKS